MSKPYPKEFRDDVVRVARNRDEGVTLEQIANDFGIHPITLSKWLRQAAIDEGDKAGVSTAEAKENRELRRRVKLLEQENEVLRNEIGDLKHENRKLRKEVTDLRIQVDRLQGSIDRFTGD